MKTIKNLNRYTQSGFTLLEILLVVAAIGILAGIVIFAINPAKQLGDTRNSQRKVDVNTIVNAVYQYQIDNDGELPPSITGTPTGICITNGVCSGLIDLSVLTDSSTYLIAMPLDPQSEEDSNNVGYNISIADNNRITVSAPLSENSEVITITR